VETQSHSQCCGMASVNNTQRRHHRVSAP